MSQGKSGRSKGKAKESKAAESKGKTSTSQMIVPVILVFMMVSAGFFVLLSNPDDNTNPQPDTDVTVVIDYGNGNVDWYNVTIDDARASVALHAASDEGGFEIGYTDPSNDFIDSIGSQANDATAGTTGLYWFFYVNDVMASTAINAVDVEDGDVVRLTYEASPW